MDNNLITTILVVTPSFNSQHTIARTINSVLSQQGRFKLIYHIQDGGSQDETLAICQSYQKLLSSNSIPIFCESICLTIESCKDAGMYDAIWNGFNKHDLNPSTWMTWINSDDILRPGACALLAEIDHQHSDRWIKWVGGSTSVVDDLTGMQIGHGSRPHNRHAIRSGLCEGVHWDFIQQEGTFFRRSHWNLWRMMANHAELFQTPWATGSFFRVAGQISGETRYLYEAEISLALSIEDRDKFLQQMTAEQAKGYLIGTAYTTKEIFITQSEQHNILQSWKSKPHNASFEIKPATDAVKPIPIDGYHYSGELDIDQDIPQNIIIHSSDWQYPAITEKHAASMAIKLLPLSSDSIYFGFPWATLIDMIECGDHARYRLFSRLGEYKKMLQGRRRVVTTCQHVLQYKYEKLLKWVGISDVFWSHHTTNNDRSIKIVRSHPFPLYPLQAILALRDSDLNHMSNSLDRRIPCSFAGARSCPGYLSDVRTWIIEKLQSRNDFVILSRDSWHYQNSVYIDQIKSSLGASTDQRAEQKKEDDSKAEEFVSLMMNSVFTLCPSGSGPNSIRLWEAILLGSIPIILSETHLLPGHSSIWGKAALFLPETKSSVESIPQKVKILLNEKDYLTDAVTNLSYLNTLYGPDVFISDIISLFCNADITFTNAGIQAEAENLSFAHIDSIRAIMNLRVDDKKKINAINYIGALQARRNPGDAESIQKDIAELLSEANL